MYVRMQHIVNYMEIVNHQTKQYIITYEIEISRNEVGVHLRNGALRVER
jgi:hypothetical protein